MRPYGLCSHLARMRRFLFGGAGGADGVADAGLLVLRLFAGLALAFGHGLGKLPPSPLFVEGVGGLGFPAPVVFAWASGLAEFGGGLLLAVGLLTRPAALFVAFNTSVAAFRMQAGQAFGERELALFYLASAVCLLLAGAGRFSLDRLVSRRTPAAISRYQ